VTEEIRHIDIADSPFAAELVVTLLRGAGIPAYVDGELLQDGFALSQALLNNARVSVPASHFERAQEVLAEARRQGRETPD
jgi:hypothetical protein